MTTLMVAVLVTVMRQQWCVGVAGAEGEPGGRHQAVPLLPRV